MKKSNGFSLVSLLLLVLTISGCAAVDLTRQIVAEPDKLPGTYTAILIGGTFAADADRVVILDLEGDRYTFQPVAPDYRIKRIEGLTAAAGVAEAVKFFSPHCAYNGYRVRSLKLPAGDIVGYEITPDYPSSLCEWGNTVTVGYDVKADGVIKVYTSLLLPTEEGSSQGNVGGDREKSGR